MKILIIGALPSSIYNFRGELLKTLALEGHDILALANEANKDEITKIENLGVKYMNYEVQRNGLNPLKDLKTLYSLYKIMKEFSPDSVLAYTIKPVIWGGFASRLTKVERFNALITGLGFAFQKGSFKRKLLTISVKFLYKLALKKSHSVIFQNMDNLNTFTENRIIDKSNCYRVNGSGVDLSHYNKCKLPNSVEFLLVARLLGEKGIREYVKSAELVKLKYPNTSIKLVGPVDPSPDGISIKEVQGWVKKGSIDYCGESDDVRRNIKLCSTFVLPSYHEGMPRTVLEAMAMGRPILTTNVSGCKDTVIDGENGWLVDKGSAVQLANKMIWFIENPDEWPSMADKSYIMAKDKFDVRIVNREIINIMGVTNEKSI